ncbi:MAG: hypothetical protein ACLR9W_14895 [Enterobacter hormaechei]
MAFDAEGEPITTAVGGNLSSISSADGGGDKPVFAMLPEREADAALRHNSLVPVLSAFTPKPIGILVPSIARLSACSAAALFLDARQTTLPRARIICLPAKWLCVLYHPL